MCEELGERRNERVFVYLVEAGEYMDMSRPVKD
jgi:hypothetical protein